MERYLDSSRQHAVSPLIGPSRVAAGGGPSNSSAASGIFFRDDGQSPALANSMSGTARSGFGHGSGEMNSSAPSIGASSLVTDANSALSGGPQLQRSASINNESYMRLPASPMSFSSNNISGSSVMDGSSIVQQSPHQVQMNQGVTSNTLHSVKQEPGISSSHAQKKPRLDLRQEDVLQQQVFHQLLQRQESLQMQGHQNPQLNAIIQQQRLAHQRQQQQQQILQPLPHIQRAPLMSQHPRPSHMQVQAVPPPVRRVSDSGLCARRLMQYMYHQRHRPPDNSILYWRKFVAEYFAPKAKKRWCLSMYENVGSQALGAFPQAAMDAWHCDICGLKSGKGFEATYEVLPRLNQIKFDRGVVDELLFLDIPREFRLASGIMVLEYAKAVQECVYEQLRVVREGQLRITFTPELKIISWEFCARRHEEFFSRRAMAPQVNQLLQAAHKYQTVVSESGTAGVPSQELQASCNMFMTAGRQLVRNLELHSLNDLGFSKRYVRCLQISEVVNSMKDLIDFSRENKAGPIESLKSYPAQAAAKLQAQKMHEVEQMMSSQSSPADQSTINKIMAMHQGLGSQMSNNNTAVRAGNNTQTAATLNNYQYLTRSCSTLGNDPRQPTTFDNPNQPQSTLFLTKAPSFNGLSTPKPQQPQSSISFPQPNNNPQASPVNQQHLEQHVIQQLLQEMMNSKGPQQHSLAAASDRSRNVASEEVVGPAVGGSGAVQGKTNAGGAAGNDSGLGSSGASVSNSFKSAGNNNSSSSSSSSFSGKPDLIHSLHLPDLDQDILREFTESGIPW